MKRTMRCGLILAAAALALVLPEPAAATEKIGQDERMACADCHRGRRAKRLNDLGMYYQLTRSVAGFDELNQRFSRCTSCHRGRAGNQDLTATGRKYRWFFQDMEGIRDWVMSRHPPKGNEPAADERPQGATRCPK